MTMNILRLPLGIVTLEAVGKHKGLKFVVDTTKERNILFADRVNELGYDVIDDWNLFKVTHQNGYPIEGGQGMQITDFIIEIKLQFDIGLKRSEKLIFEYSDCYKDYQKALEEHIGMKVQGVLGLPFLVKHQYILQIGASMCKDEVDDILKSWCKPAEERKGLEI